MRVIAALQSVFPPSELSAFMSLLRRDKEQQLNELTAIVTGIRLFNKDSGNGGESVEDREYFSPLVRINLTFHEYESQPVRKFNGMIIKQNKGVDHFYLLSYV